MATRRQRFKAPRYCKVCGQQFTPTRSHAITCSAACRQQLRRFVAVLRAADPHAAEPSPAVMDSPRLLHLPRGRNKRIDSA